MYVFESFSSYNTVRHKLFWIKYEPDNLHALIDTAESQGVTCINIGKSIALFLQGRARNKFLHLDVKDELDKIIREAKKANLEGWRCRIALYNLGILLEPELQLDAGQTIKEHAKDCAIVLFWDGFSDGAGTLYWHASETQYQLRFPDTPVPQVIFTNAV